MKTPAFLVRLYPRAWRERYGDEFVALVDETGLTGLQTIDVIRGAIRERVHDAWRRLSGRRTDERSVAVRRCPHCATAVPDATWLAMRMSSGPVQGRTVRECGSCGAFLRMSSSYSASRTLWTVALGLEVLTQIVSPSSAARSVALLLYGIGCLASVVADRRARLEIVPFDNGRPA